MYRCDIVCIFLPHHCYFYRFQFSHYRLIAQVQEDELGELDMCSRQDNKDNWLAPSHNPYALVMDGHSRKGDSSDLPSSLHKGIQ